NDAATTDLYTLSLHDALPILKKETAPYEDRSFVSLNVTAPEGSSYEYMDQYMTEITKLINDSVPEKKVSLILTSPSFGTSSVNSGRANIALVELHLRERSQDENADDLSRWTKKYHGAKVSVSQTPTNAVNRRGDTPIQYIIQAPNIEKLQEKIPLFMKEAESHPAFSYTDVNLKFDKPELYVNINREKAESVGVSVQDVAETLQLSLSGQRFGYFIRNGKQYQVIGQFDKSDRETPTDLTSIFVKSNQGQL